MWEIVSKFFFLSTVLGQGLKVIVIEKMHFSICSVIFILWLTLGFNLIYLLYLPDDLEFAHSQLLGGEKVFSPLCRRRISCVGKMHGLSRSWNLYKNKRTSRNISFPRIFSHVFCLWYEKWRIFLKPSNGWILEKITHRKAKDYEHILSFYGNKSVKVRFLKNQLCSNALYNIQSGNLYNISYCKYSESIDIILPLVSIHCKERRVQIWR